MKTKIRLICICVGMLITFISLRAYAEENAQDSATELDVTPENCTIAD
jgi:hypothetical protein